MEEKKDGYEEENLFSIINRKTKQKIEENHQSFRFILGLINFILWTFFYFEGFAYGDALKLEIFSISNFKDLFAYAFLCALAFFLIVAILFNLKYFKRVIKEIPFKVFLYLIIGINLFAFFIMLKDFASSVSDPYGSGIILVSNYNPSNIQIGAFMLNHPLLVFAHIILNLFFTIYIFEERMKDIIVNKNSLSNDLIIVSICMLVIGCLKGIIFSYKLFWPIILIVLALMIISSKATPEDANKKRFLFDYKIFENAGSNLIIGFFSLVIVGLLAYYIFYIGIAPFFYLVYNYAYLLFSAGLILGLILIKILNYILKKYMNKEEKLPADRMSYKSSQLFIYQKISWFYFIYFALVLFFIEVLIIRYSGIIRFTNSTYKTNPPFIFGAILSGLIFSFMIEGLNAANLQYKFKSKFKNKFSEINNDNSIIEGATKDKENEAINKRGASVIIQKIFSNIVVSIRVFIRYFISALILFAISYSFLDALKTTTFSRGYWDAIKIASFVLPIILLIYIIITQISIRIKRIKPTFDLLFSGETVASEERINKREKPSHNFNNNNGIHAPKNKGGSKKKKITVIKSAIVFSIILFSFSLMVYDNISINSGDFAIAPRYLGSINHSYIYEVSPLVKIDSHRIIYPKVSEIVSASESAEITPLINKSMAKNEFESIQIAISNNSPHKIKILNVTIENSSYLGLDSAFSGPAYIRTWKNQTWPWKRFTPYYVSEILPNFPNILYDFSEEQTAVSFIKGQKIPKPGPYIECGKTLSLWLTLYSTPDLKAGLYSDEIHIITNHWQYNLTLITKIWNFTLSDANPIRTAIGNRAVYYLENRDDWNKNFLMHRISPYFPYKKSTPTFYAQNLSFDEAEMEQFLSNLNNSFMNGLNSFRITYRPGSLFDANAFNEEFNKTAIAYYSKLSWRLANASTPEMMAQNKTFLDYALVYAMDEPGEDDYLIFDKWSDLVHRANPRWKILLTEQVEPEIEDYVDIWCPYITNINYSNIAVQHSKGREFWYYTCCNLKNKPTVSFVDPLFDNRAIFWTAWAMGFDGYLFWDANAYVNRDTYDPYRVGYDGIGDAIMLLSDGDLKPVNSLVWETMRDGVEDTIYFNLLKEYYDSHKNLTNESTTHALSLLNKLSAWDNFENYPKGSLPYIQLRNEIGEFLNAVAK
ncbi:MAG: glycoside hydrolase domain-containing protein [Promethearchaeota archaeon]